MKFIQFFFAIFFFCFLCGCGASKKVQTLSGTKDSSSALTETAVETAESLLENLSKNRITFNTFSAKVKVEYEDQNGKQPDFNAFIRLENDKRLWLSINATFLGIEAFRILVTPDSVTILNKLEKTVEYHPFSYLSEFAHIPLTFPILQDLLVGNPVYVSDSIVSFEKSENVFRIETLGNIFKNWLVISTENNFLSESKLTETGVANGRKADLMYNDYRPSGGFSFPAERKISIVQKNKIDINMSYKEFEFNKELSFPFSIPSSYKTK
jgi:hypothetical protein